MGRGENCRRDVRLERNSRHKVEGDNAVYYGLSERVLLKLLDD